MNEELERKFKDDEQAKALFFEYKSKETEIQSMLKEYERAKENGASQIELLTLKQAIRDKQKPLLESFYNYKKIEGMKSDKKNEMQIEDNSRQVKQEVKEEKSQSAEIKVMPIRNIKAKSNKLREERMSKSFDERQKAKIIPIAKKRSIERSQGLSNMRRPVKKSKSIVTKKRRTINRSRLKHRVALKSKIVPMSKMSMIRRKMSRKLRRVMENRIKTQHVKKYTDTKNRSRSLARRKSKSVRHMLKKRIMAVKKFLGLNKSKNMAKRKIVKPQIQRKRERQFKMIDMYRNAAQNADGHIEAKANQKIKEMPRKEENQDDKELHVIGW